MQEGSANQREAFRVNDKIALLVNPLAPTIAGQINSLFDARRKTALIHGESYHKVKREISGLGYVKRRYPEVWEYIEFLEHKVDCVSQLQIGDNHALDVPRHTVDLSLGGIQFHAPHKLADRATVELKMRLFPSMKIIYAIGRVVRQTQTAQDALIAICFTHLHNEDRDTLAKHIQQVQLERLHREHA